MIMYAIESRRIGETEWKALNPSSAGVISELNEVSCLSFETRAEAEAFIDANCPLGYEAQIVALDVELTSFHGKHDA